MLAKKTCIYYIIKIKPNDQMTNTDNDIKIVLVTLLFQIDAEVFINMN